MICAHSRFLAEIVINVWNYIFVIKIELEKRIKTEHPQQ